MNRKKRVWKSGQEKIIRREKSDGKKSERGGISNSGREKLAGKGNFSWRDMFYGGEREWPQRSISVRAL